MSIPTITVDVGRKCDECGKGGAISNGLCLNCTLLALRNKPMKSETGRLVQLRATNLRLRCVAARHRNLAGGTE